MSQQAGTKEERFLLKLFELASQKGDPGEEVDCNKVGNMMGQSHKGVSSLVHTLAKSNFVAKRENSMICLTTGGLRLIDHLLGASWGSR